MGQALHCSAQFRARRCRADHRAQQKTMRRIRKAPNPHARRVACAIDDTTYNSYTTSRRRRRPRRGFQRAVDAAPAGRAGPPPPQPRRRAAPVEPVAAGQRHDFRRERLEADRARVFTRRRRGQRLHHPRGGGPRGGGLACDWCRRFRRRRRRGVRGFREVPLPCRVPREPRQRAERARCGVAAVHASAGGRAAASRNPYGSATACTAAQAAGVCHCTNSAYLAPEHTRQ